MNDAVMLSEARTSLFLVIANRCRNDQRFFASLRMTFEMAVFAVGRGTLNV